MQKLAYHEQNQAWKWGGCSADINFGMKFARKFLDAREIEGNLELIAWIYMRSIEVLLNYDNSVYKITGDARSLMNLHNNRAGRKVIFFTISKKKSLLSLNTKTYENHRR